MRNKLDGVWVAPGEGTMPAKQLDWKFTGTGWGYNSQPNSNPDPALREWMRDMREWGELVATKCKDLEARVSELEGERDRLAGRIGGLQ
jgi:hypothetical protein